MKRGFILIELLVVIAIIGVLVGIGSVSINKVREKLVGQEDAGNAHY